MNRFTPYAEPQIRSYDNVVFLIVIAAVSVFFIFSGCVAISGLARMDRELSYEARV